MVHLPATFHRSPALSLSVRTLYALCLLTHISQIPRPFHPCSPYNALPCSWSRPSLISMPGGVIGLLFESFCEMNAIGSPRCTRTGNGLLHYNTHPRSQQYTKEPGESQNLRVSVGFLKQLIRYRNLDVSNFHFRLRTWAVAAITWAVGEPGWEVILKPLNSPRWILHTCSNWFAFCPLSFPMAALGEHEICSICNSSIKPATSQAKHSLDC